MKCDETLCKVGAVVIGRNEGERLKTCLRSLLRNISKVVYVDSGSTDGSLDFARSQGVTTIELDRQIPFTAARARNEGWKALLDKYPDIEFIQFVDGDCEVASTWPKTALTFLKDNDEYGVVCGRRRERFPQKSVYNWLCDNEWDTPIGDSLACGGDAMIRSSALTQVRGYRPDLIAGEEPELCVRMRKCGWKIRRIASEMTLHDANMHSFKQWWLRTQRGGYAFASGYHIHGAPPERHWQKESRRSLFWGVLLPMLGISLLAVNSILSTLVFSAYILLLLKIISSGKPPKQAAFLVLAKIPEGIGYIQFHHRRILGKTQTLIEYK